MIRGHRTTLCLYGAYDSGLANPDVACMFYPNTRRGKKLLNEFVKYYSEDFSPTTWRIMVIRVPYGQIRSCHPLSESGVDKILANG